MKKLIFTILFFTVCVTVNAQVNKDTVGLNLPIRDGRVIYIGVVEAEGKTKDDLYRSAQQWLIDAFHTQKGVIQGMNKEEGLIFGRGVFYFLLGVNESWVSQVTIKIECKDNKYRYSFYNMAVSEGDFDKTNYDIEQVLGSILGTQKWNGTKNTGKKVLIQNDGLVKNAILSLKNAMGKTTTDF